MSAVSFALFVEKRNQKQEFFQPGDTVPYSGIYRAAHRRNHTPDHNLTCVSDRQFPLCSECGGDVEFKLLQAVRLIDKHELFRGPRPKPRREPAESSLSWKCEGVGAEIEVI